MAELTSGLTQPEGQREDDLSHNLPDLIRQFWGLATPTPDGDLVFDTKRLAAFAVNVLPVALRRAVVAEQAQKTLFRDGKCKSHSGRDLWWKIECDALSDADLSCIAKQVSRFLGFRKVVGLPRGGLRLQKALEPYARAESETILLVDDVYTTGESLRDTLEKVLLEDDGPGPGGRRVVQAVVLFDRSGAPLPSWVRAAFTVGRSFL